jgi:hypothetical protein
MFSTVRKVFFAWRDGLLVEAYRTMDDAIASGISALNSKPSRQPEVAQSFPVESPPQTYVSCLNGNVAGWRLLWILLDDARRAGRFNEKLVRLV